MTQAPHLQDRAKPPIDGGRDRIPSERRPTYGQIQAYCRRTYGFTPQTCWIADVLSELGLTRRQAPNRKDPLALRKPCPAHRRFEILEAAKALRLS
jgi:hypothetical protein